MAGMSADPMQVPGSLQDVKEARGYLKSVGFSDGKEGME